MRSALAMLLLAIATPAWAQLRDFRIGGEAFREADIIDARALPALGGEPTILLTLSDEAAKRLMAISGKMVGKPLPVLLDGKLLMEPIVREALASGEMQISGLILNLGEAEALAKRISGKDPLPESLEE